MKAQLPAFAAIAIVLVAAVGQGRWTGRWGLSEELEASPSRLARVPLTLGEWRGQDIALSDEKKAEFKKAQVVGYLLRHYVNPKTGDSLTVLVVSGLPGPIATHGPETCFKGTGYEMADAPKKMAVPVAPGQRPVAFWTGEFRKRNSVLSPALSVAWSWSGRGKWDAVADPRMAFATFPCLYKVYIVRETPLPGETRPDEPATRLLRVLRPALDEALFDSSTAPGHAAAAHSSRPRPFS